MLNPVFWLLVILVGTGLWFLLTFAFYPLGKYLWRIWADTKEELSREDSEEEKKE